MNAGRRDEGRVLRNPRNLPDFDESSGFSSRHCPSGLSGPSRPPHSSLVGNWSNFNGFNRQQYSSTLLNQEGFGNSHEDSNRIQRSRSPVKRILRTKPNDPQLTSVSDLTYRPYQQTRGLGGRRGKCQGRGGGSSNHIPLCPSRQRTRTRKLASNTFASSTKPSDGHTNFCDVDYLDERKRKLFQCNWYASYYNYGLLGDSRREPQRPMTGDEEVVPGSPDVAPGIPLLMVGKNEQQFIARCSDLGANYSWFKTKKTVGTEILDSYTVEITHPVKKVAFRAIGDPTVARDAREVAFLSGLRQLDFFFGKKGKEEDGYINNPSMYSASGPCNSQGENPTEQPPLPPFAPPKKPPPPTTTPPARMEFNINGWWGFPTMRSEAVDEVLSPPGTCNFTLSKSSDYEASVQSSWSAMCNNDGFFMSSSSGVSHNVEYPVDDSCRGYYTSPKVPIEPVRTAPMGVKETAFREKIESVGLMFACYEMPRDIREGHEYFAFKIEFWDKKTPHFTEKSWGAWMIVAKNARESAFDVALEKLLKIYPDEVQCINESFEPSGIARPSDHELSKPISQSQGMGRGRGLSFTGEENNFKIGSSQDEWRWPGE